MDINSKKILVIRLSSLGDVVLSTPVLRLLTLQGGANVDMLTKAPCKGLFDENPYVIEVLDYGTLRNNEIAERGYDLIIDLQNNVRSRRLTRNVRGKVIRIKKQHFSKWLYLKLGINKLSGLHVASRNIQVLDQLGIKDDGKGLDIYPKGQNKSESEHAKKTIVVAMGGTYITKRIPTNLANSFISESDDCRYVLIGGSDTETEGLKTRSNTENLISKTSLSQSITLISEADLVVTGDTGMMHIAAALQKPIVVVWGSTSEVFGFYPYYGYNSSQEYASVSIDHLTCRPCSKYGRHSCPKRHMNCLNLLNGQVVRHEIFRLLDL